MSETRTWCIMRWGLVNNSVSDFVATPSFGEQMVRTFNTMRDIGYLPPILREHKREGLVFGKVTDLALRNDGIYATAEMTAWLAELFDAGHLENWSPAFSFLFRHPHAPREWLSNFLKELSFVGVPQLKNLPGASTFYEAIETLDLADDGEDMDEILKKLLEQIARIEDGLNGVQASVNDLTLRMDALSAPKAPEDVMDPEAEVEIEVEAEAPSEDEPPAEAPAEDEEVEMTDPPAAPEDEEDVKLSDAERTIAQLREELAQTRRDHMLLSLRTRLPDATEAQLVALADVPDASREVLVDSLAGAQRLAGTKGGPTGSPVKAKPRDAASAIADARQRGVGGEKLIIELSDAGFDLNDPTIARLLGQG